VANVLEQIVADKRDELKIKKELLPLANFKAKLTLSKNSFFDALAAKGTSYIFECKKASPSKGLIRANFDLDEITDAYQKEAACFSVLTDEKYFQGKFEYLQFVSNKVSQPTINKDFFIDEYQVYLGRYLGANAVLLMLSVLDDEQYRKLAAISHELNMDVLTEVSNLQEATRALALGANIIGINNRNLRDLSTDLATTERLAPIIKNDPHFKGVIISESGIYTNADIKRLSPLVDAFLVGSALMAKTNLDLAISELVYGKVKVCGITSIEQARLVASFPVSYLGFIFAPNSQRYVAIETAIEITQRVKQQFVGVFVNQPLEQVIEFAHKLSLSAVQLHGQESVEYAAELKKLLPAHCEVWKAMSIDMHKTDSISADITALQSHIVTGVLSRILLDCKVGKQTGGTGQAFDWRLIDNISDKSTLVLAGGVGLNNIQAASKIGLGIIDINSGVEDAPGNKTKAKLETLFAQLRA
jgi:indole-3-glycerol phosphate synthase/phosphoribosylanthranilate isomerase